MNEIIYFVSLLISIVITIYLFIYVAVVSYDALRPQVVRWKQFIAMPLIYLFWSIAPLKDYGLSLYIIMLLLFFFLIGLIIGWNITKQEISIDKDTELVHLRGSWLPLICLIFFLAIPIAIALTVEIKPEMYSYLPFKLAQISSAWFITGIIWSRLLHVIPSFRK